MLITEITESFDRFLDRFVRLAIPRLVEIEGGPPAEDDKASVLTAIRVAALLHKAVDDHIRQMVVTGSDSKAEALLSQVLGLPELDLTWKEIGEALGVSAQAAHRKYAKEKGAREAGIASTHRQPPANVAEAGASPPPTRSGRIREAIEHTSQNTLRWCGRH